MEIRVKMKTEVNAKIKLEVMSMMIITRMIIKMTAQAESWIFKQLSLTCSGLWSTG